MSKAKEVKTKPKKVTKSVTSKPVDNSALQNVLSAVNKELKENAFKTGDEHLLSDVSFWFSTGYPLLDIACGGGFPAGRITEIFGSKSSGKSTIVQQALVECQRANGIPVYIDTEQSVHRDRFEHFGIDAAKLVHLEPQYMEDAFEQIFKFVKMARESEKLRDKPILIIWDTIVFTPSRLEVAVKGEKNYEEGEIKNEQMIKTRRAGKIRGYMSHLIKMIANQKVAFVFVNHTTETIAARFPGQYDKPGGTACDYASSLQILVKPQLSVKLLQNERLVGVGVKFKIEKTRLSVPKAEVSGRLNFFSGIDVALSMFDYLKESGLALKEGNSYVVPAPESLGRMKFSSGTAGEDKFREAWDNAEFREHVIKVVDADFNSIVPWKQPLIAEAPSDTPVTQSVGGEEQALDLFS